MRDRDAKPDRKAAAAGGAHPVPAAAEMAQGAQPQSATAPGRDPLPPGATPWRRPWTVGFAIIAGLILLLLVLIFKPLARPLLWAAALATLVYPAHRRLVDGVGGRATVAALLSTILWLSIIIVPSVAAVNQLVLEARDLWPQLQARMGDQTIARVAAWAEETGLGRWAHFVLQIPEDQGSAGLEARLASGVQELGATLVQGIRDLTLSAPAALFRVGVTVVIFFFFLRQGPAWVRRLREGLPLEPAHADALLETIALSIGAVFRGVLLTAASQAVLATIGFVVAGAPVPILLGFLTLVCSLLPFVGAAAVWVPTAVGLVLSGSTAAGIGLAIWGALVVSLVDNVLRPYLIGRNIHLPVLWLFLAILGGLQSFGLLGLLLGPAALALFLAFYRISSQERVRRRSA
jgi:predicted PurR-regulated permease PerM